MVTPVLLLLSSALFITANRNAIKIRVCKSIPGQGHTVNLVHDEMKTPHGSSVCRCSITAIMNITMTTEPGNTCSECRKDSTRTEPCIVHCENSNDPNEKQKTTIQNGTNISINVTNIRGTIMSLTATKGNVKVQCHPTDPGICAVNEDEVLPSHTQVCFHDTGVNTPVSKSKCSPSGSVINITAVYVGVDKELSCVNNPGRISHTDAYCCPPDTAKDVSFKADCLQVLKTINDKCMKTRECRINEQRGLHVGKSSRAPTKLSSSYVIVEYSCAQIPSLGPTITTHKKDASAYIDVCSSNTVSGPNSVITHDRDEAHSETCTCSIMSRNCVTMKRLTSFLFGICANGSLKEGHWCYTESEKSSGCTQNITIKMNTGFMGKGHLLNFSGHGGAKTDEGSAELVVSCNPRSPTNPTNIDDRDSSHVRTATVAATVTSVTLLIMVIALVVVVTVKRRRRTARKTPFYMTLEAGSSRGNSQAAPESCPGQVSGQRQSGETGPSGSTPGRGQSLHGMASASVHHPNEGVGGIGDQAAGVRAEAAGATPNQDAVDEGMYDQVDHVGTGATDVPLKQGAVDEGMYDTARGPSQGPGGGGVYGKLTRETGEEDVYDHADSGKVRKVQQVTGIYGRLSHHADDEVYDQARRLEVTPSVADGNTCGRLEDVGEEDVYNHTNATKSKVGAQDNEDYSTLKQDV